MNKEEIKVLGLSVFILLSSFQNPESVMNVVPDSLISSAELSDDCVSKFTSLVRARD